MEVNMKISGNLKVLVEKIRNGEAVYSLAIHGEEREDDERIFSMNLILNNLSKYGIAKVARGLGLENIKEAARQSSPVSIEITTLQRRLDDISDSETQEG